MAPIDTATHHVTTGRPEFPAFDPLVPDHIADPWPLLERAREQQPVFWMPHLNMFCVTRYDDIRTILRDPETFSNVGANVIRVPVPEGITIPPGCPYPNVGDGLANLDAPRHTRLRKLMQPAFTRSRVGQRIPELREIADRLIDAFIDEGHTDLVSAYSNPMAIQSIAMVLGFPIEESHKFREWTDQFFYLLATPSIEADEARTLWGGLLESHDYIRSMVEQRRAAPVDDLISDLVRQRSEDGTESLTDDEIVANIVAFIAAGTDTSAIFITQTVRQLHKHALWEVVRDDRSLIAPLIEESLRHVGVVRGLNRVVTQDTELSGVTIPAGSTVYWMTASADRDSRQFPDPDRFDLGRGNLSDHVGFGAMRHFCLGAPLARVEAQAAFEALLDRIPDLRVPDQVVEYHPNFVTPTPTALRVEWGPVPPVHA